ncbi:MAG: CooT family nickel-binding protein [Anaerolineae bacterium]|nr:CooT family nickel-binding protein [Anaerolineae bacterium]
MCESKVYIVDEAGAHQVMDNVTQIQRENGVYLLVNLLGEQKLIRGQVTRINLLDHTVYLERIPETRTYSRDSLAPS